MDGVGGVLKRTADQHVARGNDISSVTDFVAHLKISCPGVDLDEVLPEDINRMKLLLPRNVASVSGDYNLVFVSSSSSSSSSVY